MKIKSINLENIRLFDSLNLSFIDDNNNESHNVILIVGENGTGKSTILKSIVSCFTINCNQYGGEIFDYDDVTNGKNNGTIIVNTVMNHNEIEYLGKSISRQDFFQYIVLKDNLEIDTEIVHKYNGNCLYNRDKGAVNKNYNDALSRIRQDYLSIDFLILYFDVFRLMPKIPITGPNTANLPKSSIEQSLSSSVQQQNIINRFLYVKQWLVNLDFKEAKLYQDTNRTSGFKDEVINAFNILFAPYEFSRITYESKILFKTPNGEVDIDDLSDGLKSVFSIIGEMLFRFSMPYMNQENIDAKIILNTEAIVLIDEIDCHLHPKWQLNIIPSLRRLFPNVQFIMTTHAPLIVSSVHPDEVYQLGETIK